MAKYTLLRDIYKLSEQKSYEKGDQIELADKESIALIKDGTVKELDKPAKKK